ncbi:solanidine UDP-glucose glucosyltransferase 1-like [Miscanthus floridulus]|uniref:solanidine UDP-glucose glucosyltransferase 1-like n=1 Tax=Miscanthus floridulus TaxID=154761 RepID=UPI0034589FC3
MASSSPSSSTLRHVAMLPFMAKGHAMPMLHLTRLLLRRGLASAVTLLATPREASFIRAGVAGIPGAAVLELPFPSSSASPQSMEGLPSASESHFLDLISATAALRPVFADALARLEPRPDLLVHDGFLPWAKDAADGLGVPRLVSLATSSKSTSAVLSLELERHGRTSELLCRAIDASERERCGLTSPTVLLKARTAHIAALCCALASLLLAWSAQVRGATPLRRDRGGALRGRSEILFVLSVAPTVLLLLFGLLCIGAGGCTGSVAWSLLSTRCSVSCFRCCGHGVQPISVLVTRVLSSVGV